MPPNQSRKQREPQRDQPVSHAPAVQPLSSSTTEAMLDVNPYVRYPLLLVNMAFCFLGSGAAVLGALTIVESWNASGDLDVLKKHSLQGLTWPLLEVAFTVVGTVLALVSCCGCVGALRENSFLLKLYSWFLELLVAGCILVGMFIILMPGQLLNIVRNTLSESLVVHYRDSADTSAFVDAVQRHLQCCGMSRLNFRDWNKNFYFNCSAANPGFERCSVPYSCCKNASSSRLVSVFCGRDVLNMSDLDAWYLVHPTNCPDSAHRFIRQHVMIAAGVCLALVVVLAFADLITNAIIDEIKAIRRYYNQP